MKRILCLILVFVAVFAVSCSKKKSHDYEERVSKKISAEEGGKIESSDGQTSIEIPAGALESDTTITMRVYDAADYPGTEDKTVISKVVEFEPTGTIFKKPVFISMISNGTGEELRAAKKKVVTAAVYREKEGKWSYSRIGYAVKLSHDSAGNPVMTTAAGDPIMLNAAGDPIMMDAAGDPIMLSAAGDPIMISAAGDPIMMSAAGDPIMMTTGHFTAFTFIAIDPEKNKPVETTEDHEMSDEDDEDEEPVSVAECGNGVVEKGEECDAGDDNGRFFCDYGEEKCELCSLSCELEQGIVSYCGDGLIDSLEGETCDDGNNEDGDSCSADCLTVTVP